MKKIWIWDLETVDIFTATFLDKNSDEVRTFVLTDTKNEIPQMLEFLSKEVGGLVGYNSLYFDAQILEYIYRNPFCNARDIKEYANLIINSNERRPDVPEWKLKDKHLDLFKVNHFDNKNRRTGLKWCEFGMDLENIEDMPDEITEEGILQYNLNDVIATKKLLEYSEPLLSVRRPLSKLYNINCINYSNTKLGSEILLKLYCEKTNQNINDVRQLRTYRSKIIIKDILFDYILFNSLEFKKLYDIFYNMEIVGTKKDEEISINYKNFEFVYGKGGIHGSVSNKVITNNEDYVIIDADVASLYPSIAIVNGLYPEHLGKVFQDIYKKEIVDVSNKVITNNEDYVIIDADVASLYPSIAIVNGLYPEHLGKVFQDIYKKEIVDVRLAEKAKKELGNKAIVEGFKEAANATYGNSNQQYSWLYDPQYTMATTINGQLLLTMLAEDLMQIPKSNIIQINTDGLTMRIPKKHVTNYYNICDKWMKLTKLQLEYAEYSKMIINDVNNYIAVYTNGKIKTKGKYEYKNISLHKNKSHAIIPRAVHDYWVKEIPVETTIKNHTNIFDFCAGVKSKKSEQKGNVYYEMWKVIKGNIIKKKLSKTVRYFISKKGSTLIKFYQTGDFEQVEAPVTNGKQIIKDWKITYFNKSYKLDNFEDYNIDYSYYISKAKKWINDIEQIGQEKLI
jgi:hypothetical protein